MCVQEVEEGESSCVVVCEREIEKEVEDRTRKPRQCFWAVVAMVMYRLFSVWIIFPALCACGKICFRLFGQKKMFRTILPFIVVGTSLFS